MSSEASIVVTGVSKAFQIFQKPGDRLAQMIVPRLQRTIGLKPHCYYREFWALRDVSFTVHRGETVGIVGSNGSGKSTLLQIICGTLQPSAGTVTAHGRICALLELGAGFNPEFTGVENVKLAGQLLGLSRSEMDMRMPEIEAFAEIGDFIHQPVKTYSSGMYVRLAFATHACVQPDILVVDEALAVGDARFQAKCMARLATLRAAGTSILFVSHDVGTVRRFCDRAVWLDGGKVRAEGQVAEVTSAYVEFLFSQPSEATPAPPPPETHPASQEAGTPPPLQPSLELTPSMLIGAENHKPVRRWGSRQGLIRAAYITDAAGRAERAELRVGEKKQIVIHVDLPEDLPRHALSVSFALKNVNGTDLVISSSWDDPKCRFSETARQATVRFELDNWMNEGSYLMVAAIEDRSSASIHYFDFVEGVAYVRSVSPSLRWGIYVPPITARIEQDCSASPQSLTPVTSSA